MKVSFLTKVFIFLIFTNFVFSQAPGSSVNALTDIQIKTAGLSSFIKYGGLSSTSYSGNLNVNLPIISFPVKGNAPFEISLNYIGSGFKPAKRDGIVGQNWSLNVGGAISRQVNGLPDTQKGSPVNSGTPKNGFMLGVAKQTHSAANVFNFNPSTTYNSSSLQEYLFANTSSSTGDLDNYEGNPDMFYFNFNGISGRFFMGNDGQIKVASNSPVKLDVDVADIGEEPEDHNSCSPAYSQIIIKDDSGNKYYFGGETKNLEYTIGTTNGESQNHNDFNPVINAWFLYQVDYYNGYTINFNYKDDSLLNSFIDGHYANQFELTDQGNSFPDYGEQDDYMRDFVQLYEYYSQSTMLIEGSDSLPGSGVSSGVTNYILGMKIQKIAILESVTSKDFRINFNYSRQNHEFNRSRDLFADPNPDNENYFFEGFYDIKLDNISVKSLINGGNSSSFNKFFRFNYEYFGGEFDRMFLTSFGELGISKHTFEYYPTGDLPKPITRGIDHWGYWNGKNANTNDLIPQTYYDENGDYSFSSDSKDPVFDDAKKGQLERLTYPTDGNTTFMYEPHTYIKRLQAVSTNAFIPGLIDVSGKYFV